MTHAYVRAFMYAWRGSWQHLTSGYLAGVGAGLAKNGVGSEYHGEIPTLH